jgi:hypothetical protein
VRITFEEICLPAIKADWVGEMEAGRRGLSLSARDLEMIL